MKNHVLFTVGGLVAGLIVGWSLAPRGGRNSDEQRPPGGRDLVSALPGGAGDAFHDPAWTASLREGGSAAAAVLDAWLADLKGDLPYTERAKIWASLQGLDGEATERLIGQVLALPNSNERSRLLAMIAEHMGQVDPMRALDLAEQHRGNNRFPTYWMRERAVVTLAEADPEAALRIVLERVPSGERRDVIGTLLQVIARVAPDRLVAWAGSPDQLGSLEDVRWGLGIAIGKLAETDPQAAVELVTGMRSGRLKLEATANVASNWAKVDPKSALEWAAGLENLKLRSLALQQAVSVLGAEDHELAIAAAEKQTNPLRRGQVMASVIGTWALDDPLGALAWISGEDGSTVRTSLLGSWAASAREGGYDGREIVAAIDQHTTAGAERDRILDQFVAEWAGGDREAVAEWLGEIEDPVFRANAGAAMIQSAMGGAPQWAADFITESRNAQPGAYEGLIDSVAKQLCRYEPERAIAWLGELGDEGGAALKTVFGEWANRDPAAAAEYVSREAAGEQRFEGFASIARSWVGRNPDAALEWLGGLEGQDRVAATVPIVGQLTIGGRIELAAATLEELMASGEPVTGQDAGIAASAVVRDLAETDRQRAIGILNGISDMGWQATAAGALVEVWLADEPAAASEWVSQLEPGPMRREAVKRIVDATAGTDGEAAFAWSASVGDPRNRIELMERSVREWAKKDPKGATAAVAAAALTDGERARLEEALR